MSERVRVVVVDDQYLARGFFEGLVRMSERYELAASLTEVMDRTMNGESVYPGSPPNPAFGDADKLDLSDREQAVLRELTRNHTNEEIADRLNVSVNTVRSHIQHMLEKTGFKNRIDLAVNAKALGVVVHDDDRTENRPQRGGDKA